MTAKKSLEVVLSITKNKKGKVLILQRAYPEKGLNNSELTWVFPGGKINGGETDEDAVVRETRDETGYNITVLKLISERKHPQIDVYLRYYACELVDFKITPIHDVHEVESTKWVDPAELKEYFTTDLDPNVAKYLDIA